MSAQNIQGMGKRGIVAMAVAIGLVAAQGRVEAQTPLGVPYIGSNHVSFYSTELTSDGVGASMSKLYGGRYGHRFGSAAATTRLSILLHVAAEDFEAVDNGVYDVSASVALDRRLGAIDERLSVAASVGTEVLAWGFDPGNTGLAHFAIPLTVGGSYDLSVGSATLAPFVAVGGAYYMARQYVDDVRVMEENGWDARLTTGASLSLKEVVFTASRIRGERGLPQSSRWTFAAGVSF